jgi:hypothetical protein
MGFKEIFCEHGNDMELTQYYVQSWSLVLALVDIQFCYQRFGCEMESGDRGELSYFAPLGSEKISAPLFQARGGGGII